MQTYAVWYVIAPFEKDASTVGSPETAAYDYPLGTPLHGGRLNRSRQLISGQETDPERFRRMLPVLISTLRFVNAHVNGGAYVEEEVGKRPRVMLDEEMRFVVSTQQKLFSTPVLVQSCQATEGNQCDSACLFQ